jgi:hypothetical protein
MFNKTTTSFVEFSANSNARSALQAIAARAPDEACVGAIAALGLERNTAQPTVIAVDRDGTKLMDDALSVVFLDEHNAATANGKDAVVIQVRVYIAEVAATLSAADDEVARDLAARADAAPSKNQQKKLREQRDKLSTLWSVAAAGQTKWFWSNKLRSRMLPEDGVTNVVAFKKGVVTPVVVMTACFRVVDVDNRAAPLVPTSVSFERKAVALDRSVYFSAFERMIDSNFSADGDAGDEAAALNHLWVIALGLRGWKAPRSWAETNFDVDETLGVASHSSEPGTRGRSMVNEFTKLYDDEATKVVQAAHDAAALLCECVQPANRDYATVKKAFAPLLDDAPVTFDAYDAAIRSYTDDAVGFKDIVPARHVGIADYERVQAIADRALGPALLDGLAIDERPAESWSREMISGRCKFTSPLRKFMCLFNQRALLSAVDASLPRAPTTISSSDEKAWAARWAQVSAISDAHLQRFIEMTDAAAKKNQLAPSCLVVCDAPPDSGVSVAMRAVVLPRAGEALYFGVGSPRIGASNETMQPGTNTARQAWHHVTSARTTRVYCCFQLLSAPRGKGDNVRPQCNRSNCRFSHAKDDGQSRCHRGKDCRTHGDRGAAPRVAKARGGGKTAAATATHFAKPCSYFASAGGCTRGASCRYQHDAPASKQK